MATPKLKVLISGAGIAGPCLAYWLSRSRLNTSITIVERSPVPRPTGQSIDIEGPAIEVIKKMNLEEDFRALHTTETGTVIRSSGGKIVAQFMEKGAFTSEYEILRADMSRLFLGATEGLGDIRYMYGDHIKALEQTSKDVHVTFAGGDKDNFDVVVGADGVASRVRDMILDENITKGSYNFVGQYLAFFSIPRQAHDTKLWQWYNEPNGLGVMVRPHRTPETMGAYIIITTPAWGARDPKIEEAMAQGVEGQKRIIRDYFKNAGWETQRVLDGMDISDDFYMSRSGQVKLPKWGNGRAIVLGDAAWATFGIGTTLAVEGAYCLAGELSKIKTADDVPQALQRYEEVFRPVYEKVHGMPPGFPQLAWPQTKWGLRLRDTVLWAASKTKVYKLIPQEEMLAWKLPEYDWANA